LPVRIRLKRVGSRKNPHYRVVVMHSSRPRDGAAIETLGHYDPRKVEPMPVFTDPERVLYWLTTGAQPTDTVRSLLRKAGIWAKFAETRSKKDRADQPEEPSEGPSPENEA